MLYEYLPILIFLALASLFATVMLSAGFVFGGSNPDDEKNSPYDHDKIYEIINVPTIIFYKDDMEFNRIVELTIETLEKDILSILSDSGYENDYYGF